MSDDNPAATTGADPAQGAGAGEKSARLVRRAPRTARALDPHGVYDARSLARRSLARRRRSLSSVLLLIAFVVAGSAFILKGREPRVPEWTPARSVALDLDVTALAAMPEAAPEVSSQVVAATLDGRLAVLDEQGRGQLWDATDFPLRAAPLVARGLAIVGGEDGVLRAFDLASRRLKWHSDSQGRAISGRPALFAAASTSAAPTPAPQPSPGATAASATAASATQARAAAASAPEAVAVGDDGGLVRALRLSDGGLLWSARLGAPCGDGLSVARVSGGRTLILVPLLAGGARRGGLAALDARDGKVAWRYPRDERIFAAQLKPPLARAVDGRMRLFCADDAGAVSALDANTGRSPASTPDSPAAPPSAQGSTQGSTQGSASGSASGSAQGSASGEWKTFLAPLAAGAGGSSWAGGPWRRWLSPGAPAEPGGAGESGFEPGGAGGAVGAPSAQGGGASGPGAAAASEPLLVSVRAPLLWMVAARGPLLLVAGDDGAVRALEARSGRAVWSTGAGEAPLALLRDPSAREASLVIVTPHAVERRDAQDGRRLSRFEWGEDVGRAQAATATRAHLFVAARRLLVFDWNAAS